MSTQQVNRISKFSLIAFSLTGTITIVVAALAVILSGQTPQPEQDEGTAAHLFQLSFVISVASALTFLSTVGNKPTLKSLRPLALATILWAAAFISLYYFEHP